MSEKIKPIRIEGYIKLYDQYFNIVTSRTYKSKTDRKRIIEHWKKLYRLEEKKYYLVIEPKF